MRANTDYFPGHLFARQRNDVICPPHGARIHVLSLKHTLYGSSTPVTLLIAEDFRR